jgi:hypothetical protein
MFNTAPFRLYCDNQSSHQLKYDYYATIENLINIKYDLEIQKNKNYKLKNINKKLQEENNNLYKLLDTPKKETDNDIDQFELI